MQNNIFFLQAREALNQFIKTETETFPSKLQTQFLNFFSELGKYEEEGIKIRPNIIFTNNIDLITKNIPQTYKMSMFTDVNEVQFSLRMKSLIPFCVKDWGIYVNIKENEINYGIIKTLNSIKEKTFYKLLFEINVLKDRKDNFFVFGVESISTYVMSLKGLKSADLNINFTLDSERTNNWNVVVKDFVNASFSKLRTTEKKLNQIKVLYENIFESVFKDVHGALCVVVDKDYVDNGFFSDGIWLKEPISFSKLFLQSSSYSESKLTSFCDLFISMLNYDGITVVDNSGTIRAYNVFVETNTNRLQNITGGARKRAAYTVINSRRKKILGVYFQSHDGEVFYKSVKK